MEQHCKLFEPLLHLPDELRGLGKRDVKRTDRLLLLDAVELARLELRKLGKRGLVEARVVPVAQLINRVLLR
jgi:hypothetical protein